MENPGAFRRPSHQILGGVMAGFLALSLAACAPQDGAQNGQQDEASDQQAADDGAQEGQSEAQAAEYPDAAEVQPQEFVTRPDLRPAPVMTSRGEAWEDADTESGEYTFLSPMHDTSDPDHGAVIVDAEGELVWMDPSDQQDPEHYLFDFRAQEYQGQPVLTRYSGPNMHFGAGHIGIFDTSYTEIARVTSAGDIPPENVDFHDSIITDDDTMLTISYVPTPADLSSIGGPADGWVRDGRIQEIDIATGQVLFDWSALDHVPVDETEGELGGEPGDGTQESPFDYIHLNSVTEDGDDSLLVSARHTHAVYQLDRTTGDVNWTLGGPGNDFELGEGVEFAWQHDAHRDEDDGTITLFDNHSNLPFGDYDSRGLRLDVDEEAMTAEVVTEYDPPQARVSGSMANAQQLDNGNMLIGWGQEPYFSEYTDDGRLIYDSFHGGNGSYRAYKLPWQAQPLTTPNVVVQDDSVFVSWNGATEVAQWRVVAGDDPATAEPVETVDRDGFETEIPLEPGVPYVTVEALDENGEVLSTGTPQA